MQSDKPQSARQRSDKQSNVAAEHGDNHDASTVHGSNVKAGKGGDKPSGPADDENVETGHKGNHGGSTIHEANVEAEHDEEDDEEDDKD